MRGSRCCTCGGSAAAARGGGCTSCVSSSGGHWWRRRCRSARRRCIARARFANSSALAASVWHGYLAAVYGNLSALVYPFDTRTLVALNTTTAARTGLVLAPRRTSCACRAHGVLSVMGRAVWVDPHEFAWGWDTSRVAIPAGTWTEVSHCAHPTEISYHAEATTALFYPTPGSGVYLNVGQTVAFRTHAEAVHRFLGVYDDCYECDGYFDAVGRVARREGFDSVQFLGHDDQSCGNVAVEVMVLGVNGLVPCPNVTLRRGLYASEACHCVPRASPDNVCASCA